MSIIGLDGNERSIIPGFFYDISMDRTGTLIAAAHYENGFQDLNPDVEIILPKPDSSSCRWDREATLNSNPEIAR